MKICFLNIFILGVSVVFLISSCSKSPDKILPKKSGKWNAVITFHITTTGVDFTNTVNESLQFEKDGTGININSLGVSTPFTWSYSKDSKKITFQKTGSAVIVFDVTTMEKKSEQWHNVSIEIIATDTQTTNLTIDLTKSD